MVNIRGIPTRECPFCNSNMFKIVAWFDEHYDLEGYMLDAECAGCGSKLTAPTPDDKIYFMNDRREEHE